MMWILEKLCFTEWLWRFLPDNCRQPGCPRTGVRGNENRVGGVVMCDDCSARTWRL